MGARAAATLADNLFGLVHQGADNYDPKLVARGFDEFDPRFDLRKNEQQRLQDLIVEKLYGPKLDIPQMKLSDLEGRNFMTTYSDRTDAGGVITKINDVELASEQPLFGGQDYMFYNPGRVWTSGRTPSKAMHDAAAGEDIIYLPHRMAPSGGDFSSMTGGTMIRYAQSNMDSSTIKQFDKVMKEINPTWPGLSSDNAVAAFQKMPDTHRKAIKNAMDVKFRNDGGLNIGEARLSVADPRQVNAREGGIMNVGEIHGSKPIVDVDHPDYPAGLQGEGLGTLEDQPMTIFDLLPDARIGADQRRVGDAVDTLNPSAADIRALQMKPYRGTITPEILKRLSDRGVDVGNIDPSLLAAMGLASAGAAGGSLLFGEGGDKAGKYVDSLFDEVLR
jgi:hypothetical protein